MVRGSGRRGMVRDTSLFRTTTEDGRHFELQNLDISIIEWAVYETWLEYVD